MPGDLFQPANRKADRNELRETGTRVHQQEQVSQKSERAPQLFGKLTFDEDVSFRRGDEIDIAGWKGEWDDGAPKLSLQVSRKEEGDRRERRGGSRDDLDRGHSQRVHDPLF